MNNVKSLLPTGKFMIFEANRAEFEALFLGLGGRWVHDDVNISDVAMFLFENGELSYTDRFSWYLDEPANELKEKEILSILRAKSEQAIEAQQS